MVETDHNLSLRKTVMKIKTLYPFLILMIIFMSFMTSCRKETITGSVSGVVTVYDPSSPLVKTPLEGINVYLVNTDFEIDSVDYANNAAAIVDYALTGSDGKYLITGIPEGNYAVVPIPDFTMYRFKPENDLDSVKFTISEQSLDHSVDFTAAVPIANDDVFQIHLNIINRPNGGSISIYRPFFLFNIIPTFCPVRIDNLLSSTADEMTIGLHFGIFESLYAVSNNLRIHAFDGSGKYLFIRWVDNDFFNTPANAHWQIDWTAQTITRIE